MTRHRAELTVEQLSNLYPVVPGFARIVDVETAGAGAVIITTEWEDA